MTLFGKGRFFSMKDSKKKASFKQPLPRPDFVAAENDRLSAWYDQGVVKEYLHKNDGAKEKFFFLDGPITANNPMGVHHAWGRTLKDMFQRYHNMKGKAERFQSGFDCQGLWVEVEVEKELGFTSKKDIEEYGVGKFVNQCKKRVLKYSAIQTEQSKRLGYFMDWDNSYYTMSDENNYTIWHLLKQCHKHNWLYKGFDVVPWCPRCGTAISQHEILQEEYKVLTHKAVFFKLALKTPQDLKLPENSFFLAWTTTPWTIPGNTALAVNPDLTYMAVLDKDVNEVYILLGEKTAEKYPLEQMLKRAGIKNYQVIKKFKGSKLVGHFYQAPFADLPVFKDKKFVNAGNLYKVVAAADMVSGEEGTALVHVSTGTGHEDFHLGKKEKLPVVLVVGASGKYLPGFGLLEGKNGGKNPDLILNLLKEKGFLKAVENYKHRYPTCWRCKQELIFRAVDEWYIDMDPLRKPMMEVTRKIKWLPSWGMDRELDWLKNMDDWLISKKRYWGLALPIWECKKCGNFEVIGSKKELKQKAVEGWEEFKGNSPHKPWIDKVKIKCSKCNAVVSRIPDVGNPWLDAGIVPFSTLIDPKTDKVSYLEDKKYWQRWFPADLVLECFPGQFKNWFYSMLAMSTILENKPPFTTLVGHGLVKDEKGEEMHKSKGNAIWFDEAVEKMGADVMRWIYSLQPHTLNLNFGYNVADKTRRRFHLVLWNIYNFFVTYANLENWQPAKYKEQDLKALDRWILTKLEVLAAKVTANLDKFDNPKAARSLERFVTDLSGWYVRRSRDRVGQEAESKDKETFLAVLYYVLTKLCLLLAPFVPFMAEEIFKNLTGKKSVHLQSWPEVKKTGDKDLRLLDEMKLVREIVEQAHALRKEHSLKVRQPLAKLTVAVTAQEEFLSDSSWAKDLFGLIEDELNVKKVVLEKGSKFAVKLDSKITPQLKKEGEARELVRAIQQARKKAGLKMEQKAIVYLPSWPKEFEKEIKTKAMLTEIKKGSKLRVEA